MDFDEDDLAAEFDRDGDATLDTEEMKPRIAARAAFFVRSFDSFNRQIEKQGLGGCTINKVLLANLVQSYFQDIARLKHYHQMGRADRYKIAAYTLKWWLRVRPIQIAPDAEMATDHALRLAPVVNEGFAMLMAFHLSTIPYKKIPVRHSGRLLYSAHYRDTDPGVMAHFLEVMRDAWAAPAAGGAAPPPAAA